MAYVDWRIKGPEIVNCNCDWGCPCQFNALPTHGDCRAALGMRIDEGHFGDVDLAGVKWAAMYAWPKAIHEGHGEALAIVDPAASEAQRNAVLTILTGGESEPGATVFGVFASTLDKLHEPRFLPVDFQVDIERRRGHIKVPELLDIELSPITNPITGAEHRARVSLPHGFEYREAEYASGRTRSEAPIPLSWDKGHGHTANLNIGPHGPL
ncbi:MAG TPA: DUF1326 domain-containing protein [Caulobacteraceae bacterium]|jgi:hypothetical protein|nr:DUF1326 domain-containing protein [Caulobacteraceae bacterium]